ncbi:MAG: FAD-dependent oxidoreductase [Polyangiales bacterium]
MSARYYDVVVLGADLAPLTCAALLAKRGFRVLVLGQDEPAPTYQVGPFKLPQRPSQLAFGQTPVSQRVIVELGLGPTLRRPADASEPAFQVAVPGHRFDVPQSDAELARCLEREFPEVRRPIEELHERVRQVMESLDTLFASELVLPPETFLERQRFARARRGLRGARLPEEIDALAEFPEGHRFRQVAALPARFEGDIDASQPSMLRMLRLYGNCRRGSLALPGGLPALRELFLQKILAHSGQLRTDERAEEVLIQRGEAVGVRLMHSGDEIACGFVVVGVDVAALPPWLPDRTLLEGLFERVGEPMVRHYRYTLNVVVRRAGMPAGLGTHLYFVSERSSTLRSQELHVSSAPLDAEHSLICAQALLPARKVEDDPTFMQGVRADCLDALRELLPFLEQHLVLVDSPHDGLAPDGPYSAPPRTRRGPSSMPALYSYPVVSHLGLCALPIRTPIKRLLLCNAQIVPGLGSEGQLMAASSAARVITWADRSRSWMRRRLWAKVEM